MSLRIRSFILALFVSLGGVFPSEAKTYRCDAIFQPTVADVLNQLNRDHSEFLFKGPSFESYTQNLSWMRKRKLRKLVQELEVRSFTSEKAMERYSIELSAALFGTPTNLNRWVTKTSEQRFEDSTILLIKEQLLKEGLVNTWGDVHDPKQISLLKNVLDRIGTFQSSRVGEVLRLPFFLPSMKNKEVSSELMFKIIRDGFNAHAEEARIALKQQTKIDAYNTFRKVYAPVFFGVIFVVQMQNAYQQLQDVLEQQVQQTVRQLREQRQQIEEAIPQLKQQEFQRAYDATIAEFIQKWGEPPTAEEAAIIKAKIVKALNMPTEAP